MFLEYFSHLNVLAWFLFCHTLWTKAIKVRKQLDYGPSLREVRAVIKTGTEKENLEEHCLPVHSLAHLQLTFLYSPSPLDKGWCHPQWTGPLHIKTVFQRHGHWPIWWVQFFIWGLLLTGLLLQVVSSWQ